MSFLDFLKKLFSNGKKSTNIIVEDFIKYSGNPEPLQILLIDNENNPLTGKEIIFDVNGVKYNKKTDNNGIAKLNINLSVDDYDVLLTYIGDDTYNSSTAHCKVYVNPYNIITEDLTLTYQDGSKFTAILKDKNDNPLINAKVVFNINGVNYTKRTDTNGVAGLNINLNPGEYTIKTLVNNLVKSNNITVNEKPDYFGIDKHYGYWVFGRDMYNVNLDTLKESGVTDIFLNYYSIELYGEDRVKDWMKKASPINVHVWMQCFYDGEWHNPVNTDLTGKIAEAKKYSEIPGVAGVHLDYLRYPGNAYKTSGGAEAITDFTRRVRDNINKNILLSCAVMPESDNKYYYGQDLTELGKILDFITPMQYKGNYNAGTNWLASTTRELSSKATIWSGLQSYRSDDDTTQLSINELENDIETCIDNGASGVLLFRYGLSPNIKF